MEGTATAIDDLGHRRCDLTATTVLWSVLTSSARLEFSHVVQAGRRPSHRTFLGGWTNRQNGYYTIQTRMVLYSIDRLLTSFDIYYMPVAHTYRDLSTAGEQRLPDLRHRRIVGTNQSTWNRTDDAKVRVLCVPICTWRLLNDSCEAAATMGPNVGYILSSRWMVVVVVG